MKTKTRHITLFMLGASLMFSACSSGYDIDDPTPTGKYAISFGANDGEAERVTRASGNTTSLAELGYDNITVYGYKTVVDGTLQNVMPGYAMKYTDNSAKTSTTNTTGWEYVGQGTDYLGKEQEIKYWDGTCTDYRFFGVLPSSSSSTSSSSLKYKSAAGATAADISASTQVTTDGSFELSFTGLLYMTRKQKTENGSTTTAYYAADGNEVEEKNIPVYGHLWQGAVPTNYNQPVALEFVKPYALVRVAFVRTAGSTTTQLGNADETDHTHNITFAPVSGSIAGSGSLTVNYPMTGSSETYSAEADNTATTLAKMSLGTVALTEQEVRYQTWPEYVMVPTNASGSTMVNGDFRCTAYIYSKNSSSQDVYTERTAVVPAQYMQWKPGYQYTYVFTITSNNNMEFSHVVEVYTKWQAGYVENVTW